MAVEGGHAAGGRAMRPCEGIVMGRHTTPGVSTPGQRDEVIGWGAFSTGVSAVLVGVLAGWFEGLGVVVLGALTTGALWVARNHADVGIGRGRHASDTPWSPTDLLELKDSEVARDATRRTEEPVRHRAAGGPDGAAESRARRSRTADRRPAPRPAAERLRRPGAKPRPEPVADESRWSSAPTEPAAPAVPIQRATSSAPPVPAVDAPSEGDGPIAVRGVAGGPLSVAPRRSGRRESRAPGGVPGGAPHDVPDGAPSAVPDGAPAGPAVVDVQAHESAGWTLPQVPGGRRSRRMAEATGGPTPPVLPVPAFGVHALAPCPPTARTEPASGSALPPAASSTERGAGLPPVQRVPVAPAMPDPLADPITLGHDRGTDVQAAERQIVWERAAVLRAIPHDDAEGPATRAAEPPALDAALDAFWIEPAADASVGAPVGAPVAAPPSARRVQRDRDRAAAAIDAVWARRARRPERPRGPHDRPAAARREPVAEVRTAQPDWQPVPTGRPSRPPVDQQPADVERPARHLEPVTEPVAEEPTVVVLPEPDVPEILLLPGGEGPVVDPVAGSVVDLADGPAEGSVVDAVVLSDDRPLGPDFGVPASRPAPGTLTLDELLVLHTRRPTGRRTGSDDQAGRGAGRRLE
jgi:hypothetical protein